MPVPTTPAYITTVGPDRTIVLPAEMAEGTTIAVIVLPDSSEPADNLARKARFEATLNAIRAASVTENSPPAISDEQLNVLIKKARRTSST